MYLSYKLCSHIVAVAEQQKLLEEVVGIFGKSKAEPNLTSLVMTGMPKSSGKKPGAKVPKKRSKSIKPQPTTIVETPLRLSVSIFNPMHTICRTKLLWV